MINAVESNSEEIHGRSEKIKLKERAESDLMAANEDSKTMKGWWKKAEKFKALSLSGQRGTAPTIINY